MKVNWKSSLKFDPDENSVVLVRIPVSDLKSSEYNYCVCVYSEGKYISFETGYEKFPTHWDYLDKQLSLLGLFAQLKLPSLEPKQGLYA